MGLRPPSSPQDVRAITGGDPESGETDGAQSTPTPDKPVHHEQDSVFAGTLGGLPIWVEMRIPVPDGEVSGTYLYAKYKRDIPLTGVRNGLTLELREGNPGKITGEFHLVFRSYLEYSFGDYWYGAWNKPGRKQSLPVRLFPARADFKACYLADPDSLTMSDGKSFSMEMTSHLPTGEDPDAQPPPSLDGPIESIFEVTGCSGGLMSVDYTWFHIPGFDPLMRRTQLNWTFDLSRKREIRIWQEIDSAKASEFTRYLSESLFPQLAAMHQTLTEEWEDIGKSSEPRSVQSATDDLSILEVRIDGGKIGIGWKNYFDLSERQMALSRLGGGEAWIELSPEDMLTFLRKDSALRNLIAKK